MTNSVPFNRTNSELHNVLPSNQQTGLSFGTKVLDIGFENCVTVVVLEIYLSEKALVEVECNLETAGSGGKSALVNTNETAFCLKQLPNRYHRYLQHFWV